MKKDDLKKGRKKKEFLENIQFTPGKLVPEFFSDILTNKDDFKSGKTSEKSIIRVIYIATENCPFVFVSKKSKKI